jgi:hypothetical protein
MQAFELPQLITRRAEADEPYLEFLKVPDLSMGCTSCPRAAPINSRRTRRTRSITW